MAQAEFAMAAAGRLQKLPQRLETLEDFAAAAEALEQGRSAALDGVWGSGCALAAAALAARCSGPLVVVLPQQADILEFQEDWALFSAASCQSFPAWESDPGERILHDEIFADRLRTLKALADMRPPKVVATSIQSLLQPVPQRDAIAEGTRRLSVGQSLDTDELLGWLAEHQFHATSAVEMPGEFSARGGILDLFAPDWQQPVRIELFGDEIESIRSFDIASQRSLEPLEAVDLTVLAPAAAEAACLTDYLPTDAWLLLVEPEQLTEEGRLYLRRVERPDEVVGDVASVLKRASHFPLATMSSLPANAAGAVCHLPMESVERFSGDLEHVRSQMDQVGEGQEVFIAAPTEAEIERLNEVLGAGRLAAEGRLHFVLGSLRAGFRLTSEAVVLISGAELFQRGHLRRLPRRRLGKAIDSFLELRSGDLVVHLAHGIGRYRGLELLEKDGRVEEHLAIEFDGGTRVYVPASKIHLVQKYIGGTKSRPSLAKLGGKSWVRQKRAAQAAVVDMASQLLELHAQRATRTGISFGDDSDWQREFDASFPYQETPDQLGALKAIKSDMQRPRPMDRLLCGDVGFGKTEVAMRAAFKAVDSGYQVAVLAPTTILAEQHYRTFRERMAEFPFDIARLSRFCSTKEEREILTSLANGQVDVVIGTHRLASKDVRFLNLGLVIIDEEQRFGVEVKERLKSLRATVDVLTMSATPIPRTLHMSLVGVRDISNLETPPEDRLAVETRVSRWNDELIRHAVLRELNRGGQIFFVHNRVQDIEVVRQKLKRIAPEARIGVAHGQMPEGELERMMVEFVDHQYDVLLATTIVESGLDIPNANTIFIDEADRYGLADLHQLRGRVGRYKHRAYCYLLIDPHKHITPNAARRLRAIEEFSEMGSGFAISIRDLEIRGAGNLLGVEQSGHIASVGYELYCQLLEGAVRSLQHLPPRVTIEVDVDLPGEAFLPDDYVGDMRLKIDLYRRLTRCGSFEELGQMREELNDRFGPLPEPVERMLSLAELKLEAAGWGVQGVHTEQQYLVLRYADRARIEQLAQHHGRRLRIVDTQSAYLTIPAGADNGDGLLKLAKSVLQPH